MSNRDKVLRLLLLGVGAFDAEDYFLTSYVTEKGHGELNPVIGAILSTWMFPAVKLVLVPGLLILLWFLRKKEQKRMLAYLWILFTAYASLMVYFRVVFL